MHIYVVTLWNMSGKGLSRYHCHYVDGSVQEVVGTLVLYYEGLNTMFTV